MAPETGERRRRGSRAGGRTRPVRLGGGGFLLACGALALLAAGAPGDELRALVRELLEYEKELAAEESRWRDEKEHLETTRALLEREREALRARVSEAEEELDRRVAEAQALEASVASARGALEEIDRASVQAGQRLLETEELLPGPLRDSLAPASRKARSAFSRSDGGRVLDRLQVVAALATDLLRALSAAHASEEVLEIEGRGRREAEVLYLGAAIGYYVARDGSEGGLIVREGRAWKPRPPSKDLGPRVRRAIEVFEKKRPAAIVELPLAGGGGRRP